MYPMLEAPGRHDLQVLGLVMIGLGSGLVGS